LAALTGSEEILKKAVKRHLGRNIGFVPAQREIVTVGAYRYMRHPIYTGLILRFLAVALRIYGPRNAALLATAVFWMIVKSFVEESFLRADPQYAAYMTTVRARWIPSFEVRTVCSIRKLQPRQSSALNRSDTFGVLFDHSETSARIAVGGALENSDVDEVTHYLYTMTKLPSAACGITAPTTNARGSRHINLYRTTSGRIMSCSSCSRMWQCQTYSLPPVLGLEGTANGTDGILNCMITVVTSSGFILTVSFQPASFGSGGRADSVYVDVPL
jgi:hypothetical protein